MDEPIKQRWFMSYAFVLKGACEGEKRFGQAVTEGEHPIARIARWNSLIPERTFVLLFYRDLSPGEAAGVGRADWEI